MSVTIQIPGALSAGANQGAYISTRAQSVEYIYLYAKTPGSAGSTIVDIHKNGVTIFTTQASRPSLAFNDADGVAKSGVPDVIALAENDVLTVDIDQAATDAEDLTVEIALSGEVNTPASDYTTLAAFKSMKTITTAGAADDAFISDAITRASRLFDDLTHRTFYARTETHYYDVSHDRVLWIGDDDLLTVTTLTNGDGTVLTANDYFLFPRNSSPKYEIVLKQSSAYAWEPDADGNTEGVISVEGTWGRMAAASADVEEAVLEIVKNAYGRRHGESQPGKSVVTNSGVIVTPEDIPARAWDIIRHYQRRV